MKLPRRNFCIWRRALPRFRPRRASLGRKPIRRGRCASIVGFAAGGTADIVGAPDRTMAFGAARPAIHCRGPAGRRRQCRDRGGRACAARRLYASLAPLANAINATLYDQLNFDFIRDIAPVAGSARAGVMEVNPSFPAKTFPNSSPMLKPTPAQSIWHRLALGRRTHIAGELFKMLTGIEMIHVPYRGYAPGHDRSARPARVQVMFDTMPNSIQYIKAGQLRPLAVTTTTRWEGLPDAPDCRRFCARL